jgi:methylase of polypeptide subunit release factors
VPDRTWLRNGSRAPLASTAAGCKNALLHAPGSMGRVLSDVECRHLASALAEREYTVDAVIELLGVEAHGALGRNNTVPGVCALAGRTDPLATLTVLWVLQQPVPRPALDRALAGLVDPLIGAGILRESAGEVVALLDIRPYASDDGASGWVVSDLSPHLDTMITRMRPDFVLGVSTASATLAQLTIRRPAKRALDLGTGCGVQSLHLAQHVDTVVATDLNPRAIQLAGLTAKINSIELDLRQGDLFDPVADEEFDLIVTNPPYVMSPASQENERLTYREGSRPVDSLVHEVVRTGAAHLAGGGVLQVLANWAHLTEGDWSERLRAWVATTGCDAHVVQRETLDPSEYVEMWLSDAGLAGSPEYRQRYREWLDYFAELNIEAVGMGWIVLQRNGRAEPDIRIEDWPYSVEQPIGPVFDEGFKAVDLARSSDADLLAHDWRLAEDVVEETRGSPGAADPRTIVLRQQRGFRRAVQADTALAAVLGACDGDLDLHTIVATVAGILSIDPTALTESVLPVIRSCIRDGFLG